MLTDPDRSAALASTPVSSTPTVTPRPWLTRQAAGASMLLQLGLFGRPDLGSGTLAGPGPRRPRWPTR